MKKMITPCIIVTLAALATGCASTADFENVKAQVDALTPQVEKVAQEALTAKTMANDAAQKAAAAEAAANRAASYAKDTNTRIDRMMNAASSKAKVAAKAPVEKAPAKSVEKPKAAEKTKVAVKPAAKAPVKATPKKGKQG